MFSAAGKTAAVATAANYIEDVFSTYLYTGTGSSQTITNGIDLAGKGGLVWSKSRSSAASHALWDTARGAYYTLYSDSTDAQFYYLDGLSAFNSNGFVVKNNNAGSGSSNVSWTFRKQPKFFDVVTWTGNGSSPRNISHNLGSVPGCIIAKRTDSTGFWVVYHRSTGATQYLFLNTTAAAVTETTVWDTTPTSTQFTVGTGSGLNNNGATYVAYLFAHNAGGFGLTGTDNVISCGSFTTDGSGDATVTLGYEPQWTLIKRSDSSTGGNWRINDNMRNMVAAPNLGDQLFPNLSNAESIGNGVAQPTATGFTTNNGALNASATYIYIAIRRGPMKTPTTGTSVFGLSARGGSGGNATVSNGSGVKDLAIIKASDAPQIPLWVPRLTGTGYLTSSATDAEIAAGTTVLQANPWDVMTGVKVGTSSAITNLSGYTYINYLLSRAPGFFDVVCYTGTGSSATSYSHNLGVAPELIINKVRSASGSNWIATFNFTSTNYVLAALNLTIAGDTFLYTDGASIEARPTSTAMRFTGGVPAVNDSGQTYVAYLFASCPGVSKVFSFTGNGSSQTINCGFTGGSRLVLIKRTDSTGNWVIFDSARGIVSGNDPALYLNSTAAEVTGVDAIDTDSTGFIVNQETTFNLNVNNATYIGLAIS